MAKLTPEVKESAKKLVQKFRKSGSRAKNAMDKALNKVGREVAKDAKKNLSRNSRSGLLKRAVSFRLRKSGKGRSKVEVGAAGEAFYGRFLEFGTGTKGQASNYQMPRGMLGKVHKYNSGKRAGTKWKGQPARPWLAPALTKNTQMAVEMLHNDVISAIKEGGIND